MSNTYTDFRQRNKFIRKIEGIKVTGISCYTETTEDKITNFTKFLGYPIPEKILNFYKNKRPFVIAWTYRSPDTESPLISSGRTALAGMDEFIWGDQKGPFGKAKRGERLKYQIWHEGDDPQFIEKLERDFFIFDYLDYRANTCVLFQITKENPEPKLFLFTYPDHLYPLSIDFDTYIEYTEKLKGTHLWQLFFIDRKNCNEKELKELENLNTLPFFSTMKKLFPDVDLSSMGITQTTEYITPSYIEEYKKKNYKQRFDSVLSSIENKMKDYCFETEAHKTSELVIKKAEKIIGRQLPDSLIAFYLAFNGLELNWKAPNIGKGYRYATVRFPQLFEVFSGFKYTDNPKDPNRFQDLLVFEEDDPTYEMAQNCYPIVIEEFHTTVLHFVEGQEEPDLYLFVLGTPYKLTISFEEFLNRFLETRGLIYWQYQFIDKDAMPNLDLSNDFVTDMKTLFPEVDLTPYRQE